MAVSVIRMLGCASARASSCRVKNGVDISSIAPRLIYSDRRAVDCHVFFFTITAVKRANYREKQRIQLIYSIRQR